MQRSEIITTVWGSFTCHRKGGMLARPTQSGSVIFVATEVDHGFFDISEELEVLVLFAPAESS